MLRKHLRSTLGNTDREKQAPERGKILKDNFDLFSLSCVCDEQCLSGIIIHSRNKLIALKVMILFLTLTQRHGFFAEAVKK